MSFKIVKKLTPYNFTDKNDVKRIKYIVIHYFGSLGTAQAVANYFANAYRGASTHYSLDEGENIYQIVKDEDIAWHCGTSGTYYHPDCRNSNSIGIEVRPHKVNAKSKLASDTDWYFKPEIVDRLVEFTKYLMKKYNVPADRVIRHYDVTHKICPNPFVVNAAAQAEWVKFKQRLIAAPAPAPAPAPKPAPKPAPASYLVRVTATALNIRSGPGTQYSINGVIRDKGTYTIVDTKDGWGKLKSGAGWIYLSYTKKV